MPSNRPAPTKQSESRDGALPWIAAERALRAILLVAVGLVLVTHLHTDWARATTDLARRFGLDPTRNRLGRLVGTEQRLTPGKLRTAGIIALAYGALEGAESYGLFRRRRWGEYLTVLATSLLLIPEVAELVRKQTVFKVAALVVNVAIVAYLVVRLRRGSESPHTAGRDAIAT